MPYIDKINVGGTNYDIGGGGHVIEDVSGTELTQRDTLQIAGTLKVTDDDTYEKTVISDAAEEIEWSVWNEMTEEERDIYSAGKKLDIVNVPGADGTISADLMTLLWTNPSPSAEFVEQTITLLSDDYDALLVEALNSIGSVIRFYVLCSKGYTARLDMSFYSSGSMSIRSRTMSYVDDTHYSFSSGSQNGATSNSYCIPLKIYGIKKTINLKVNAIASDVSTSASKCMMSDGETSVEDEISGLKNVEYGVTEIKTIAGNSNSVIGITLHLTKIPNYFSVTPIYGGYSSLRYNVEVASNSSANIYIKNDSASGINIRFYWEARVLS